MEKAEVPAAAKSKVAARLRNHESDVDSIKRSLTSLSSDRANLFGSRYRDDPAGTGDEHLDQRQQLLTGTDRLNRSSNRIRESQRLANETEAIGAGTLSDLAQQRNQLENTRDRLLESEGYTDRSIKTLRGMARRYGRHLPFAGGGDADQRPQNGYESYNNDRHHYHSGDSDHCCDCQQIPMNDSTMLGRLEGVFGGLLGVDYVCNTRARAQMNKTFLTSSCMLLVSLQISVHDACWWKPKRTTT